MWAMRYLKYALNIFSFLFPCSFFDIRLYSEKILTVGGKNVTNPIYFEGIEMKKINEAWPYLDCHHCLKILQLKVENEQRTLMYLCTRRILIQTPGLAPVVRALLLVLCIL